MPTSFSAGPALSIRDVGVLYAGSSFNAASMLGQQVLKQIGQTGIPCINVSNACASGATAVREAFVAVKSGLYDVALAVGAEKNPRGMLGGPAVDGPPPEGLFGSASMRLSLAATARGGGIERACTVRVLACRANPDGSAASR